MSVFITGDTHGNFTRFKPNVYPVLDHLTKDDYVIICGDFGGVWDDSPFERRQLNWLDMRPYTTLFISGNHENYDLLNSLPVSTWHGGTVQFVRPSVLHLMRGQIFTIGGKQFFTMGGASCHDIPGGILEPDDPHFREKRRRLAAQKVPFRVNHRTWWKEELPDAHELKTARRNLKRAHWEVDYIITHCCPSRMQEQLTHGEYPSNELTDFLDEVWQRCTFRNWFFGHYHADKIIAEKFLLLYLQIVQVL